MHRIQFSFCEQPFSDAASIAHHNYMETCSAQQNRFRDTMKDLQFFPTSYILAFDRGFLINDAITIEKCRFVHGKSSLRQVLK